MVNDFAFLHSGQFTKKVILLEPKSGDGVFSPLFGA